MNKRNNAIIGIIFIVLGVLFLLQNLNIFRIYFDIFDIGFIVSKFWPLFFLILPGIAIHSIFFSGKNPDAGILVPGGILLTIGTLFQVWMLFGYWNIVWPGFLLGVAVGLFELYYFGKRDKGLLVPIFILGGLSLFFYSQIVFSFSLKNVLIPVLLILIGISVIVKNTPGKKGF